MAVCPNSNLNDAYAQPRPLGDRHDTKRKCKAMNAWEAMLAVIWLSKRMCTLATETDILLAIALPQTQEPMASIRTQDARKPYARRRLAGVASAHKSKEIVEVADNSTEQSHRSAAAPT